MAKAIEDFGGLIVGHVTLMQWGQGVATPGQAVHDGDTIGSDPKGNLSVRFLGVDAPEISFTIPGGGPEEFVHLGDPRWEAFLADAFAPGLLAFNPPLADGLKAYLLTKLGPGCAANHDGLAKAAKARLRELVEQDIQALGLTKETFEFFMVFANDVMDRYGRLLGYINRNQLDPLLPAPRPLSYNERLLQEGHVTPYFIWPNVNPYRRSGSVVAAAESFPPGSANDRAESDTSMKRAREAVASARANGLGVFSAGGLRLLPFELRFLARRQPPERWVIDQSKNDRQLIPPQDYYTVPLPEDRLFVPAEFVPLLVHQGWRAGL
jgi:endonuclease YncB( thermonuclease family)